MFFWRFWREIWPEDEHRRCIQVTTSYSYAALGIEHVGRLRQTREERDAPGEGSQGLPGHVEGDEVEVRYHPVDHARSTLTTDAKHLASSGASLLEWGSAYVLFGVLGAGLSRLGEARKQAG